MKDFRQFKPHGRVPASRETLSRFGFGWRCARDLNPQENFPAPSTVTAAEAFAVHQGIVDDHIEALLKTYDLNGDGSVTSVEVATVLQSRNRRGHGGGFHR